MVRIHHGMVRVVLLWLLCVLLGVLLRIWLSVRCGWLLRVITRGNKWLSLRSSFRVLLLLAVATEEEEYTHTSNRKHCDTADYTTSDHSGVVGFW